MRICGYVAVLALLAGCAFGQAASQTAPPPAKANPAPAAAQPKPSPAEQASMDNIVKLFRNPATLPEIFDQAITDFRQEFPNSAFTTAVLVTAVRFHRQRNDYLPELHYGIDVLQLDPNNLYTLSTLGAAIPQNVQSSDLDMEQRLAQAQGYDNQVVAIAQSWKVTPQGLDFGGNHFTAAQAQTLLDNLEGPAYASLGRVAWLEQKYPDAIAAYRSALPFETTAVQKAQTYYNIGASEAQLGHAPEAQVALKQALSLSEAGSMLYEMIQRELQKVSAPSGPGQ